MQHRDPCHVEVVRLGDSGPGQPSRPTVGYGQRTVDQGHGDLGAHSSITRAGLLVDLTVELRADQVADTPYRVVYPAWLSGAACLPSQTQDGSDAGGEPGLHPAEGW